MKSTCPLASRTRISISAEDAGLSFSVDPPPPSLSDDGWFTYDVGDMAGEDLMLRYVVQ